MEDEQRLVALFRDADADGNGSIDHTEFQALLEKALPGLSPGEIAMLMAEADENDNGLIEFAEFIPLALEVMESLYAKSELNRQQEQAYAEAEDLLMHGLTQEQFETTLSGVFSKADVNGDGRLNKVEFRK